jgi:hypothetical protein
MRFITVEDFDNAVKQPRSYETCIVAQTAIRLRKEKGSLRAWLFGPRSWAEVYDFPNAEYAATRFDAYFARPGDELKPELQDLRSILPLPLQKEFSVPNANENQQTPLINPK